jgi:nucleoside-diphosphate-sugar epimerase
VKGWILLRNASVILREDIDTILSDKNIPWNELLSATILITGATGLIGGMLARVLSVANVKYDLNMRLIAHGRNQARGFPLSKDFGLKFICGDIRSPLLSQVTDERIDYIFHCASITSSVDMIQRPVDVIATNFQGSQNALELALASHTQNFVYLSSMEVYGQAKVNEVYENDLGDLDLTNPRSSYPESKRICEMLCVSFQMQYGLPVKIARLARTFGAGTIYDETDMRVANQFARKALAGEDIELHTSGESLANCCYTSDAIRGILTILFKGKAGEAYNVADPNASATIREMAEIVASKVCEGKIKVIHKAPEDLLKRGYASDVGFKINADKLRALGWAPMYRLDEMFRRMIADWMESQQR